MILFRYLVKEVGMTLFGMTGILVIIFMSNQVMLYMNRAARGSLPGMLIIQLLLLELPNLLSLLLPLGFYFALLIAYGRLYADSEMVVLQACGYSSGRLLKHTFWMALMVASIVATMMSFTPQIAYQRSKLLESTGLQTIIQTVIPGRFKTVFGDQYIYYVEKMNTKHTEAQNIFLAKRVEHAGQFSWDILTARQAKAKKDPQTGEDYLSLTEGKNYQGIPGQADYQISAFQRYEARLPHPKVHMNLNVRTMSFRQLLPWNNSNLEKVAEMQWRISIPLMVFVLSLVGVPLSRVNPRAGKFSKLLPGILLAFIYSDFLFIVHRWVANDKIPTWIGMWGLHVLIAALGLGLLWHQRGYYKT